ncbi:MAG: hypothetical protein A2458_03880 [Candidatus Kerfeldbacteria bacterium RIFOXYC2_FULL_38_9]|nr:MAG: hypothetical protein A2458_03880 [Candidatus Kerfeldbacteria bacterium RIFOXYC2_FULL_38_9]
MLNNLFSQLLIGVLFLPTVTLAGDNNNVLASAPSQKNEQTIIAGHHVKKEHPVKKLNFQKFPGVTISDTAAVLDVKSGKFLYRQEATKQRAIASLSKLATSLVFLEDNPDLQKVISYASSNNRAGATVFLNNGEQLRLNDVLMSVLLPSANNMAQTLAVNTHYSYADFVVQMNNRMQELGLKKTQLVEPTGLNSRNVSCAGNLAKLGNFLFNKYPDIFLRAAQTPVYDIDLLNSVRNVTIYSTNRFDGRGKYDLLAFKTGFYPGTAERTLVVKIQDKASGGQIIVVLLGNTIYGTINEEAYQLADWAFNNWEFKNY